MATITKFSVRSKKEARFVEAEKEPLPPEHLRKIMKDYGDLSSQKTVMSNEVEILYHITF